MSLLILFFSFLIVLIASCLTQQQLMCSNHGPSRSHHPFPFTFPLSYISGLALSDNAYRHQAATMRRLYALPSSLFSSYLVYLQPRSSSLAPPRSPLLEVACMYLRFVLQLARRAPSISIQEVSLSLFPSISR
jgi:hypothetical protein